MEAFSKIYKYYFRKFAIDYIPKFLKASNFSSNAGNCCDEQVGVKAPGNENIKTLFSENKSLEEIDIHALSPSR